MMKSEFVSKVRDLGGHIDENELTEEDYGTIEHVYMFHPSIPEVNGKEAIARIWMLPGGMRIIRDMVATAEKVREIEDEERKIRAQISQFQSKLNELIDQKKKL